MELLVAMALAVLGFAVVFEALSLASRMGIRNLSANIGHENIRISSARMTKELEGSVTPYGLVNWTGNSLLDVNEAQTGANRLHNTGTKDPGTGMSISSPANGVKFRRLLGPGLITDDIVTGGTTVRISMPAPHPTDIPDGSDLLYIPLLTESFPISSVSQGAVTSGSVPMQAFSITLQKPVPYQVLISGTSSTSGTASAYILKRSAFVVVNQALYYFPKIPDSSSVSLSGSNSIRVRGNVTSPQPFSLLYSAAGLLDNSRLRTLIQSYDSANPRTESTGQRSTFVTVTLPLYTIENTTN